MKHASFFPAVLLASTIAVPAFAETPRIITLQGTAQTGLPGAQDGARHGIKVRRGSGFPDPIVIEVPAQVADETPTPVRKVIKTKRRYGW